MSGKRQNNQWELAYPSEDRGEAPKTDGAGTEPRRTERATESPADSQQLMEVVCQRENLASLGLRRVGVG